MSKIKMRCNTCGKWFQSANAKEVTCPDCLQKARREKMAAKTTPPPTSTVTGTSPRAVPPPPKPKPTASGTSQWLDTQADVKVGQPDQPVRPKLPSSPAPHERERENRSPGPGGYREGNRGPGTYREGGYRGPGGYREGDYRPGPYRVGGGMGLPDTISPRPRQPMPGGPGGPGGPHRGPRPGAPGEPRQERGRPGPGGKPAAKPKAKAPKPKVERPPKPKREKIPPPAPFKPTEEQIAQVEARYAELAVPTEFDGIRTQISKELGIPKTAVKKIIKEYRERNEIPSWWEIQTYKGSEEELAKIKALYEPYLPLPPIGVHKQIAEELSLKPGEVYQAIKAIRLQMNLPQYNDPALHGLELKPKKPKTEEKEGAPAAESGITEEKPEPAEQPGPTQTAEPELVAVQSGSPEEQVEPTGEVSSIETDTKLQKVDDSVEVAAAAATDAGTSKDGEA